ncbi:MAG: ABC transporter substrate-binding protein [Thiomargarita sp.]|nr:ABC transporter substrate-binding protein [Thiomargarita sp.]
MRVFFLLISLLPLLSGCDFISYITGGSDATDEDDKHPMVPLSLAVAPHIAWMPWYLANEEEIFHQYATEYKIQFEFVSDNYQETIDQFLSEEVHAVAISNIDAIAQLIKRELEVDVILITNKSAGNDAILLPSEADTSVHSLRGKTFALVKNSVSHYLFDRYLIRHQLPFDDINILDTAQVDIPEMFTDKKIYGVVTNNPNLYKLINENSAKILFDSRQVPKEIFDMIIVRRETLLDYPDFAQVLLASWFSVMERLQGNKRGPTLDALANLASLSHQQYEAQLATTPLNDTSTKALAAIRDRRIRKSMRHIRYFIERHKLSDDELFTNGISYPGRTPAIVHFNGQHLQHFVTPETLLSLDD